MRYAALDFYPLNSLHKYTPPLNILNINPQLNYITFLLHIVMIDSDHQTDSASLHPLMANFNKIAFRVAVTCEKEYNYLYRAGVGCM